jgi:predicted nucleotidyltransferase
MVSKKKSLILTKREQEVLDKKLSGKKLTQQDSNYLSKFVRPKLREISSIDSRGILDRIEYNQKIGSIEGKIRIVFLEKLRGVENIILYGSAIQTNYKNYNDIDVLVVVQEKIWRNMGEKYKIISSLKKDLQKYSINADIEIYDKRTFKKECSSNPSLIYQLKDKKELYGKLSLSNKLEISKISLRAKMDYSVPDEDYNGEEIYRAIRNLVLVNLLIRGIVDNKRLVQETYNLIGLNILKNLRENKETKIERKIARLYLKELYTKTLEKINNAKWEKIKL